MITNNSFWHLIKEIQCTIDLCEKIARDNSFESLEVSKWVLFLKKE